MASSFLDAVARALGTEQSRRASLGALLGAAVATISHDAHSAKRNKKDRRKNRKGRNKHKKNKKGKNSGRCKSRHSEKQVLGFIAKAAKKYGQSRKDMERVARCESGLDPCAVNRSGPYYGLYQFLKSTWNDTPYKDRSIWDPKAQAFATAWMWKKGRKNEWACK